MRVEGPAVPAPQESSLPKILTIIYLQRVQAEIAGECRLYLGEGCRAAPFSISYVGSPFFCPEYHAICLQQFNTAYG
jgi:hypothetical protein